MRTGSGDLTLTLDRSLLRPLREQLGDALRAAILDGTLPAGTGLPSSRSLAQELSLSRDTIVKAYLDLETEGWVQSRQGAGTWVAELGRSSARARPRVSELARARPAGAPVNLRPDQLDPDAVDIGLWRRAWRQARPSAGAPEPAGSPALRAALARHLGTTRALPTSPEQIVLCAGPGDALTLLAAALGWAGQEVLVEDPGAPRTALAALGVTPLPVAATESGIDLDAVEAAPAGAVAAIVTPGHQFPLGGRLALTGRQRLLRWAAARGGVVVEDDYDGEFRLGAPSLPTLASLDTTGSCVYVGTLSLLVDPGLRLSYLRVPNALQPSVVGTREALGATVSRPVQDVVTWLLDSGELGRHATRVRRLYAERRAVLRRELAELPAGFALTGLEAGLHAVLQFPLGVPAAPVLEAARAQGVSLLSVASCAVQPPERDGLVIGFVAAGGPELARGLRTVRELLPRP